MGLTKIDDRGLKTPIDLQDNEKIRLGTGNDLQLYHSGTNSVIDNNTGSLYIRANVASDVGGDIFIQAKSGEDSAKFTHDGSVELRYDNVKKLETRSDGLGIEGDSTFQTGSRHKFIGGSSSNLELGTYSSSNSSRDVHMSIDSAGRTGIGVSDVSGYWEGGDQLVIKDTGTGGCGITIHADTDDESGIFFADGTTGNAKYEGYMQYYHSDNSMRLATSAVERMRIDSSGNVGIGEASPLGKVHIQTTNTGISSVSGDADEFILENTGHCGMTIQSADDGIGNIYFGRTTNGSIGRVTYNHSSNYMYFQTNAAERMRIDSAGGLFLGVTSAVTSSSGGICFRNNDAGRKELLLGTTTTSTRALVEFINGNGGVGSISVSGSNTSYNTSSDYRLKENVTAISDGITRLKTLKPSRFNFKTDKDTTVDGFLAHEVTAVPEAVTGTKDEVATEDSVSHKKGDPIYQAIDQSKLVPLLTAALQEAIAKIETLETKVAALEAA